MTKRSPVVPAALFRGGTSKCWVFKAGDLPAAPSERNAFLCRLFGSPDSRQIDGVGGGTSTTSKALIIDDQSDADRLVRYEVAQVSVDRPVVEWDSNCGNCASAVALYAVQEGLVNVNSDVTHVPLLNSRTGLLLDAELATPDADPPYDGDQLVPGTAYPGVQVRLHWAPGTWSMFGKTLPTGRPTDELTIDGRPVRVTLVDAGAPVALLSAIDLSLELGSCTIQDVEAWLPFLIEVRSVAGRLMLVPGNDKDVQSIPKVGIVGRPQPGSDTDVEARMVSMTAAHPALGITSAVAIAAASGIRGTVVDDLLGLGRAHGDNRPGRALSIGTFVGAVRLEITGSSSGDIESIVSIRSARRLLDATVAVPAAWEDLVLEGVG